MHPFGFTIEVRVIVTGYINCYRLYKFAMKALLCNTLCIFILLTVACSATVHTKRVTILSRYMYTACPVLLCAFTARQYSTLQLYLPRFTLQIFVLLHSLRYTF